jgi:hypothetical protein
MHEGHGVQLRVGVNLATDSTERPRSFAVTAKAPFVSFVSSCCPYKRQHEDTKNAKNSLQKGKDLHIVAWISTDRTSFCFRRMGRLPKSANP